MTKITYLIGAGASAQALPLIKTLKENGKKADGIPKRLREIAQKIANSRETHGPHSDLIKDQFFNLAAKSEEFDTIDTYAKYCSLNDPKELKNVKNLLVLYFLVEQKLLEKLDTRYLIFLTTLLEHNNRFPDNIRILNWNYDSQFQMALDKFTSPVSGIYVYPNIKNQSLQPTDYNLIYLNGIADYKLKSGNLKSGTNKNDLISFINHYYDVICENENLLTFAWENNKPKISSQSLEMTKNILDNTTSLVIIGYSFPFFNREIDREIFKTLFLYGTLKTIYYQDKFNDGDYIRTQFNVPDKVDIFSRHKVDQFFIPFEY